MGQNNNINNAAKEAARFASVQTGDWDDIRDDVVELVEEQTVVDTAGGSAACNGQNPDICIHWIDGPDGQDGGEVGSYVRVIIRHDYNLVTPLPGIIPGPQDWEIETCAIVRVERPVDDSPSPPQTSGDCD
jgi:hypothetical protein